MNENIRVGRFIYMFEFGLWALKRRLGWTCFDPNNINNNINVMKFFHSTPTIIIAPLHFQ
jgi:hypothetical protein